MRTYRLLFMKNHLLFIALAGALAACQQESDVQPTPSSLLGDVAGTYRTNFYIDPSTGTTPASQLPSIVLKAESDSLLTLTYTVTYPASGSLTLEHVRVKRQADQVQLRFGNTIIGTLQTDRVFTDNGMEEQAPLLRINLQDNRQHQVSFTGYQH